MNTFLERLAFYHDHINTILKNHLPQDMSPLSQAMRYTTLNGGKRLRPFLVYAVGELLKINIKPLDMPACAIEYIHCFSLIHDDLPAMDDDDLRRGKPTCHKAFNEAIAILAGDALQTLAFELLSTPTDYFTPTQQIQMIQCLAHATGAHGMTKGQALDITATSYQTIEDLTIMHQAKTGELITASIHLGLIAADCHNEAIKQPLIQYANFIGLAFQIRDDILDIIGSTIDLGKKTKSDEKQHKTTYASYLGIPKAKEKLQTLLQQASEQLTLISGDSSLLKALTNYLAL